MIEPQSNPPSETSDQAILDLLRQVGPQNVSQLADSTGVTATAVRQRLSRLMAQNLIERSVERAGRGRPSHKYSVTVKGLRQSGTNYADLAIGLWREVRQIEDAEVRRGLLKRLAAKMSGLYRSQVSGSTTAERMHSLKKVMGERNVPFEVEENGQLPVLTARACPYPELAQEDRAICAVEKMLFSEILDTDVKLGQCRLDGASCCTFVTS